jgi:hypothetical protein
MGPDTWPYLAPPPLVYPSKEQKVIQASKCGNISHRSQEQRKEFLNLEAMVDGSSKEFSQ